VAVVTPLMETRGNRLVVETDADLGTMHADLTKVRQSLLNVLSNAAKFTEQGTITLSVQREDLTPLPPSVEVYGDPYIPEEGKGRGSPGSGAVTSQNSAPPLGYAPLEHQPDTQGALPLPSREGGKGVRSAQAPSG
jgi:hypothetical protein